MENYIDYTAESIWGKRGKPALLNISKDGRIRFTVALVKLLGIKEGQKILFRTYNKDKGIIYFSIHKDGVPLRLSKADTTKRVLEIYCRPLAVKLLEFFSYSTNKSFDITKEQTNIDGINFYFILKENLHKPIKWKPKK